jgi:hypothetical protein
VKDGIIAGVKGWHAALLALPMWVAPPAGAADDLNSAARELGRRTAAAAGREAVSVSWRNVSSLGSPAVAQARGAFETALRESGARSGEGAAEAQIAISENATSYLLVEEFRKGEERRVWIASWTRAGATPAAPAAVLEKRLLWEQEGPILDVAVLKDGLLVLTPTVLIRTTPRQSMPIGQTKPWPRDPRGRLRVSGPAIQANLPGVACSGTVEPFSFTCRASDEPWAVESGSRALLLANFAANRNYFDGRVVTQGGVAKTVAPFYSAAAANGFWILAGVDGQAQLYTAAMEPAGSAGVWGSDIAGTDLRCGDAPVALATRPGEGPDAVQALTVVNRAAVASGQPVEMPGPVTALWPDGIAVVRNGSKYQAYAITAACAQ